jgi:hypothetical protein
MNARRRAAFGDLPHVEHSTQAAPTFPLHVADARPGTSHDGRLQGASRTTVLYGILIQFTGGVVTRVPEMIQWPFGGRRHPRLPIVSEPSETAPSPEDQLAAIASLSQALEAAGIEHWLFGGWGVDLLGG